MTKITKKKIYRAFWIFFLLACVTVGASITLGYFSVNTLFMASYEIKGEVINNTLNITKIGVSADTYMLHFGRMIANKTNMTKIIEIHNPTPFWVLAYIKAKGNASAYLFYPYTIKVGPYSKKEVYIKFYARDVGNYSGNLTVFIKHPSNKIGEWVMLNVLDRLGRFE